MANHELKTASSDATVSVVIPLLNEVSAMQSLIPYLESIDADELVVVDGGSKDGSFEILQLSDIVLLSSEPGRARQMNLGADITNSDYIVFLHADTKLPSNFRSQIKGGWGRFDLQFDSNLVSMSFVSWFINLRSRITGIATGDQAIFVRRDLFHSIGGFKEIAIMEDVDLSHRLRKCAKPYASRVKVTTSARRWEQDGVLKTILLMWRLRLAFVLGARPSVLKRRYRDVR